MGTSNTDRRWRSAARSECKSAAMLVPPFHCLHQHQISAITSHNYSKSLRSTSYHGKEPDNVVWYLGYCLPTPQWFVMWSRRVHLEVDTEWWRIIKVTKIGDESTINYQQCVHSVIWTKSATTATTKSLCWSSTYIIHIFVKNEVETTKSYN